MNTLTQITARKEKVVDMIHLQSTNAKNSKVSCSKNKGVHNANVFLLLMTTEAHIKDLKPRDRNKILEGKIYRAWIHRDPPDTTDKGYRAILLDKQVSCSKNKGVHNTNVFLILMTTEAHIKDLKPRDRNKILEGKIYRAWIHRDPPDTTDKGYRAILLDKQGDAIQANINAEDINHFTNIVIPGKTYRISGFTCIDRDNWQQTLRNPTSLSFTRFFTTFHPIEDVGFPNHYFNFISYNELPYRVVDPRDKPKKPYPILTDYIGCYINSGEKEKIGNPNRNQLTLWADLAEKFNKDTIDALEKPIIIAVTSYRVSRYSNNLQLSSTPATYFYINPKIPQLEQYRAEYRELHNLKPPLPVVRQPFQDREQEKNAKQGPSCHPDTRKPANSFTVKQGTANFILNEILDKPDPPKQLETKSPGSTSTDPPHQPIECAPNTAKADVSLSASPFPSDLLAIQTEEETHGKQQPQEKTTVDSTRPPTVSSSQITSKKEMTETSEHKTANRPLFQSKPSDTKKNKKE
ncbi:replication protein A 70 kDa DNA-binding subunit [Artemisia annua]|uniref:Replication protein A 70 kDa DNA-binding subunit n=1 Tax=Artemisia annua TaxID=35608 RepID=A0A2U1P935_ARTAN|nr:replication protein A 70 kDa DNA-binding subunit [Artemisia annua]